MRNVEHPNNDTLAMLWNGLPFGVLDAVQVGRFDLDEMNCAVRVAREGLKAILWHKPTIQTFRPAGMQ